MTVAFALEAGADGALRGSVVDRDGAPLAGVNIQVDGTEVGAVTDAEGEFELVVDEGTYSIRASLIGYTTATVDEIGVMPGRTATVEFTLTLEPIELSSTLISASAIGEDVRRAPNRVNIIDRQEIERTLARNIQEVLQNVEGLYISRGEGLLVTFPQIIVRGMSRGYLGRSTAALTML